MRTSIWKLFGNAKTGYTFILKTFQMYSSIKIFLLTYHCTKMKFSIKDFFSKRDFIFCAVYYYITLEIELRSSKLCMDKMKRVKNQKILTRQKPVEGVALIILSTDTEYQLFFFSKYFSYSSIHYSNIYFCQSSLKAKRVS